MTDQPTNPTPETTPQATPAPTVPTAAAPAASAAPVVPAPPALIGIEDFAKVQLRAAKILAAEPHPKADKLMVLQIDLGDERRQIVAGIRPRYPDPAQLVGKTIIVVANLKPAKLRGVESNGMLLAAHDPEGKAVILTVEDLNAGVMPGSKVS